MLHGEEKREEGDRDDQERRGRIKMGESNIDSNQIPMCSPRLEHPERLTELHRGGKREGRDRGDQEEKRRGQKDSDRSGQ